MAKRTVYHLSHHAGTKTWKIKREGLAKPVKTFRLKKTALAFGQRLAKKHFPGQLKIHDRWGRLQNEYTYGNDPRRYPS